EPALQFRNPRLQSQIFRNQRRDLSRLPRNHRNQFVPRRFRRRFANHPILESETQPAVEKNLSSQLSSSSPNLGSYLPFRVRPIVLSLARSTILSSTTFSSS